MFDITNIDTWDEATDNDFTWRNDLTFFDYSNSKNISEKLMVLQMKFILSNIKEAVPVDKYDNFNKAEIVNIVLDNFVKGLSPNEIIPFLAVMVGHGLSENSAKEILLKSNSEYKYYEQSNLFDVYNESSWHNASDKQFVIQNTPLFGANNTDIVTEKNVVDFIINIFKENTLVSKQEIENYGKNNVINIIIEELYKKTDKNQIIQKIYLKVRCGMDQALLDRVYSPKKDTDDNKELKPPSKILMVMGIALLIGGLLYCFSILKGFTFDLNKIIIGTVIMCFSIPFFAIYSSFKSKYFFQSVLVSMSRWVGSSSNELIMSWGAPSRTYKFPTDKTMTVLEYKESIRNYAGYRYKGFYTGQSKSTKYIKSFFVKDGVIIDYKYEIK